MNEKLKELYLHAFPPSLNDSTLCRMSAEKFAELLVREFIERGDVLVKHYINNHSEQEQAFLLAAIADYSNEIVKHFGVEQDDA